MKRKFYTFILFISICLSGFVTYSQNPVPNGNFESWDSTFMPYLQYYPVCSNREAFSKEMPFNCIKTTDSYHGSYAVKLTSEAQDGDTLFGYFINSNPNDNPANWHGGVPYDQKPTGLKGYFKSNIALNDTGLVIVAFSKAGVNIGSYTLKLYGIQSTYAAFTLNFNPPLSTTPDSVIVGFTSSNAFVNFAIPGSTVTLDSISFTGVTSQPANLNGDFELWQNDTIYDINSWYYDNNEGLSRTTDAFEGKYAISLVTQEGTNQNGSPRTSACSISTGYYKKLNGNTYYLAGGYPYSYQTDSIAFWYKYLPSSTDTAQMSLNFKKDGNQFMGFGMPLTSSSSYKYVRFPFNLPQAPDSVVVSFQSSQWKDSSLVYVGSKLLLDGIHFISDSITAGLHFTSSLNGLIVYPNPASNNIYIESKEIITTAEIIDMTGKKLISRNAFNNKGIDISILPEGVYFIRIITNKEMITRKFIKE